MSTKYQQKSKNSSHKHIKKKKEKQSYLISTNICMFIITL